jgi:hypothetical protein
MVRKDEFIFNIVMATLSDGLLSAVVDKNVRIQPPGWGRV